jgi:hypothetical protein
LHIVPVSFLFPARGTFNQLFVDCAAEPPERYCKAQIAAQ